MSAPQLGMFAAVPDAPGVPVTSRPTGKRSPKQELALLKTHGHLRLPGAVAVLRDWLIEAHPDEVARHLPPNRSALAVVWVGQRVGAPSSLLRQANADALAQWKADTEPAVLLRALALRRGRLARNGFLDAPDLFEGARFHVAALLLAQKRDINPDSVSTWLVRPRRWGRASDQVRFRGSALTVHRVSRVEHDTYQTISGNPHDGQDWPPEGWDEWFGRAARYWLPGLMGPSDLDTWPAALSEAP